MCFFCNQMELKVINEITTEIKNFKSIEEFDLYYQKHKDEMNNQTTQYLNRVYRIVTPEGTEYRITKKNCSKDGSRRVGGDIYLKKVVKVTDLRELENDVIKADQQALNNRCSELTHDIENIRNDIVQMQTNYNNITQKLASITNTVNQIAKYINEQMSQI